ncbi:hypothetical protein QUB80_23235 [Chlorogloeopsis sp. ULAP01]|jgi:hypothetical protein|uniref:hypothetical protein n=1 Tax=Chlorogloeopsis sp. ULAP01 TaxID=3056483 RepID=UPI0025AB0601|nr:hypothetical protein [Chlorogloeopsis sp. ULAP01]MDM9383603.1 hypothetical protein [Chlorogloeopsis sp. ULAP01]
MKKALLITWEAVGQLQFRQLVLGLLMLIIAGLSKFADFEESIYLILRKVLLK